MGLFLWLKNQPLGSSSSGCAVPSSAHDTEHNKAYIMSQFPLQNTKIQKSNPFKKEPVFHEDSIKSSLPRAGNATKRDHGHRLVILLLLLKISNHSRVKSGLKTQPHFSQNINTEAQQLGN